MERDYNTEVIAVYDRIAAEYYRKREHLALIAEMDTFVAFLQGKTVLDAGCGNGRDALLLSAKGCHVTAIDYSDEQLVIARNRKTGVHVEFYKMNLLHLDFPAETFDGIWCCTVLPHFKYDDIRTILTSFRHILKKEGVLFLTLKKGKGETYVEETEFEGVKRFTAFYDEADVGNLASQTGLEIIEMYTYNDQKKFDENCRDLEVMAIFLRPK